MRNAKGFDHKGKARIQKWDVEGIAIIQADGKIKTDIIQPYDGIPWWYGSIVIRYGDINRYLKTIRRMILFDGDKRFLAISPCVSNSKKVQWQVGKCSGIGYHFTEEDRLFLRSVLLDIIT